MQACPSCGEFYDTDKFPEDECPECFEKHDEIEQKEKYENVIQFATI